MRFLIAAIVNIIYRFQLLRIFIYNKLNYQATINCNNDAFRLQLLFQFEKTINKQN